MEKTIDDLKVGMNDSIIKNHYYEGCIPITTAKINFTGYAEPYECFCYHFMGITLNIKEHFNDEVQCSICLNNWDLRNNEIIKLSCNHYFHKDCILDWFLYDNSCPICRCSVDSCLTPGSLDFLNEVIPNNSTTDLPGRSNTVIRNNKEEEVIAVITHILPFSINEAVIVNNMGEGHIKQINSDGTYDVMFGDGEIGNNIPINDIKAVAIVSVVTHILPFSIDADGMVGTKYTRTTLLAKEFTVSSVISEMLYNKLKDTRGVEAEMDEPTFYITTDNDIYMSEKYVVLQISFPYIYYKSSFTTNNEWIPTCGKTPIISVKFKIINLIQNDLLLVSKYDLSKNLIEAVQTVPDLRKDASGNLIPDSTIPIYNYSLMKVEKYTKEQYLIPYAYVEKTEVDIEILGNSNAGFNIINIIPPS
jgi:hypothetical protein